LGFPNRLRSNSRRRLALARGPAPAVHSDAGRLLIDLALWLFEGNPGTRG